MWLHQMIDERICTCLEWQHTGKPCQYVLAFVTSRRGVDLEQFVHDYYSVDRFKATYGRENEPMTGRSQWPHVQLPFVVGAPLNPGESGRQRKLRIKGCLKGGHKKRGRKDGEGTNSATNACDNATNAGDTAPTNAKGKKMIRGPMTC